MNLKINVEVVIFLEETCKCGNLEKYLIKNGWTLQLKNYKPPEFTLNHIMNFISNPKAPIISRSSQNIQIPVY
jgi:hypothetical protein